MAYAFGYDPTDFESDEDESYNEAATGAGRRDKNEKTDQVELPNTIKDMDKMDIATLEKLGWMEPLGYRALSEVTGLRPPTLRSHFWASKLSPVSSLYQDIDYYFRNSHSVTHGVNLRMTRVIELKRYNENNSDYKVPNVRLLWHGTQTGNVAGILTNGFRLPTHHGMFGPGVYFADRVSKSAQYCRVSTGRGSKGILFLCAVNLGRIYETPSGTVHAPPHGFDSVMGRGTHVPDPNDMRSHRGAMMPCGRTITAVGGGLFHNEFIVYDLSKIAILFLIEFEYL
ncbi:Poly [ADP-ribose] polymerase 2 [Orchesella cincta]|uniref:Poly [ADP-ribose] polymerase n=1 Tax=Orchesella cincta TaxID=48709 RepID=A0A1D2NBK0_ORCCI|nr:Poly [ADP-ribose] polymerase 2 [Orchesella cincta]